MTTTEKQYSLPEGWIWTELIEVSDIRSGYGFPLIYQGEKKGDLPFFKVGDISRTVTQGKIYLDISDNYISNKECNKLKAVPFKAGTIVFAKIGEALKLNRRAILLTDSLVDNNVAGILPREGVENKYLFNFLKTIKLGDISRATTVPSVRLSDLQRIRIPIPPLNEQKRIVTKLDELLSRLDAGINSLKKTIILLRQYRQSVLEHSFEGKLTEKWRRSLKDELEPTSVFIDRITGGKISLKLDNRQKETSLYNLIEIPIGWMEVKISDFAEVNPKLPYFGLSEELLVSFIPMKSVEEKTGKIDLSIVKKLSEVKKGYTNFINGDILFAKITPCMENGKIAIVEDLRNGIGFGSTEFHIIRLKSKEIPNRFLFYYFLRDSYRKDAQRNMTGSAGQLRVPSRYLSESIIALPPIGEQKKIIEEIEKHFSLIETAQQVIEKGLKSSEELRKSILKNAFEGKLVPQDPTDESADIRLERIKKDRLKYEENSEIGMRSKKLQAELTDFGK